MISVELQKKVDRSIKLLQSCQNGGGNEPIEVAYSGGKDSDVILQLAKESGINYRAIYKNTTIDPVGTIKHVKEMGVEMVMPKNGMNFFKIIEKGGFPNRMRRFCCAELKEYKILDKAIIGVRKEESRMRNERYQEPTACRFYGSKKEHVERRLGCMCCPLQGEKKRIANFKANPRMVKAYIKAGQRFLEAHPNSKVNVMYKDVYEWFYRDIFFVRQSDWEESKRDLFGEPNYKKLLEDYFGIKF